MMSSLTNAYPPVRTLRKVRKHFLYTAPDENPPNDSTFTSHSSSDKYIGINKETKTNTEQNKELQIGHEYIRAYFHVTTVLVETRCNSKVVTLNLLRNENAAVLYWDHAASQMENYGDLEAATWAHRIKTRQVNYKKAMLDYYALLRSEEISVHASLRKAQRKAVLTCREIESKYPFQKTLQILKKEAHDLLSCSYSEEFLKEIGHTPDSFSVWAKENGLPKVFDNHNIEFQSIMKDYIGYIPTLEQPVKEGEELETVIHDKDGKQRRLRIKFIGVFDPASELPFNHCYLVINKAEPTQMAINQETDQETNIEFKKKRELLDETADRGQS